MGATTSQRRTETPLPTESRTHMGAELNAICGRPFGCKRYFRVCWHVVGCCHLSGLDEQRHSCGPVWEFADRIHFSFARLGSALPFPGSSGPVSPTVVPYPPSTAYVPDASDRLLSLRRDRGRSSVTFVLGEQRPDHPRHLVGERDRDEHARLARQHPLQP